MSHVLRRLAAEALYFGAAKGEPVSLCTFATFGQHSPANSGEGCAGCDAEHERVWAKHVGPGPYVDPFERGAAVAFGFMGMAEAIRERERRKLTPNGPWPCGAEEEWR